MSSRVAIVFKSRSLPLYVLFFVFDVVIRSMLLLSTVLKSPPIIIFSIFFDIIFCSSVSKNLITVIVTKNALAIPVNNMAMQIK